MIVRSSTDRVLCRCIAAVAGIALSASSASAALLEVYGSPGYTPGVGGLQDGRAAGVSSAGIAVGSASKYDASGARIGQQAVRWGGPGIPTVELGHLGASSTGSVDNIAWGINDAGTAAGHSKTYAASGLDLGRRALRWDSSGTVPTELGGLGTDRFGRTDHIAYAINDAGTAVGLAKKYSDTGTFGGAVPVRWDASGTAATELGNLGTDASGRTDNRAVAVNSAGTAVGGGNKYDASGTALGYRAIRWDASGTVATELGNLGTSSSGTSDASASDVNDTGTAVGSADKYDASGVDLGRRAVRWDASGTAATELGILGTDASGTTTSRAVAINNAGTAVGLATKYDESGTDLGRRAVRWETGGTAATELGNLGTSSSGVAETHVYAINDPGIAVGYADDYDDFGTLLGRRAVYWGADAMAVDLNTLIDPATGWILNSAEAISDTSWIAGSGLFDPDGAGGQEAYTRLFVLQVPEPTSLAALGILGAGLLTRQRRRRR